MIRVKAVRAVNGRIQGWAVERSGRELWFGKSQARAMTVAHLAARGGQHV